MGVAMDPKVFVRWEEVFVSNEKGNRVVHYYLDRADGGSDLAVVGKERSLRHMTYTVPNHFLRSLRPSSSLRWRSRREVVDWLSSLVAGSVSCGSSPQVDRFSDVEDPCSADTPSSKSFLARKSGPPSKDFMWIGSPWTCRKRRSHYQSFCRNGITITVHDFVYVMTEGRKRLVAYLEDLYEDVRGNNLVVVRWFHKIDEVGIVLPPNFNDREIFFSLCLQDLSVECIDGLATVLSPQHFQKFLNEATTGHWDPHMCHRKFDNDDITPFDVTQLEGYWNQEFLKYIYSTSASAGSGRKRSRKQNTVISLCNGATKPCVNTSSPHSLSDKDVAKIDSLSHLSIGSQVEVLCQDSGIRGCWFEAIIIKKHKHKVKVRYQDLLDADDIGNLEEWILASRMVPLDRLGHRQGERAILRPCPPKGGKSAVSFEGFKVGSAVEVRWHQGWWEGFVIQKLLEDKFSVYFPGEGQTATFSSSDLRVAKEWSCNRWNPIEPKTDLASLVLTSGGDRKASEVMEIRQSGSGSSPGIGVDRPSAEETRCSSLGDDSPDDRKSPDNRQGERFINLKWSVSKKRKRSTCGKKNLLSRRRRRSGSLNSGSSSEDAADDGSGGCEGFVVPKSLKVDREVCKLGSDPLFMSSMPISNLVLSR